LEKNFILRSLDIEQLEFSRIPLPDIHNSTKFTVPDHARASAGLDVTDAFTLATHVLRRAWQRLGSPHRLCASLNLHGENAVPLFWTKGEITFIDRYAMQVPCTSGEKGIAEHRARNAGAKIWLTHSSDAH
jgi:hypothetical protein